MITQVGEGEDRWRWSPTCRSRPSGREGRNTVGNHADSVNAKSCLLGGHGVFVLCVYWSTVVLARHVRRKCSEDRAVFLFHGGRNGLVQNCRSWSCRGMIVDESYKKISSRLSPRVSWIIGTISRGLLGAIIPTELFKRNELFILRVSIVQ